MRMGWSRVHRWTVATVLGAALALTALATPASAHANGGKGTVYFREVLCTVPAFSPPSRPVPLNPHSCSPSSTLTVQNLATTPSGDSAAGFTTNSVPPDSSLAGVPTTPPAKDTAKATVLLAGRPGTGATRFLLGPAQLTTSAIAHADAHRSQVGRWVVDYTMTTQGAMLWDWVAQEDFHLMLAIDLDGIMVSAPIIQPTQSQFSSFEGRGEISDNLSKAQAMKLAHAL
jgi:hypothetical protein